MYKIHKDKLTGQEIGLIRLADEARIPTDPANSDYQAFLAWCEQGNTPIPADEVQP